VLQLGKLFARKHLYA